MRTINFLNRPLPLDEAATKHFCFIGATGSGKTVSIRLLLQSVLPVFNPQKQKIGTERALIYDVKRDMFPILQGIVGRDRVITLNPFDTRGYAWNMYKDIDSPSHAQEIATILIPPNPNASQPFFANAARHLLRAVITVFIKKKVQWALRDVVFAMMNPIRLKGVLESCDETKDLAGLYFSHEETSKNIMSEIATGLGPYEVVAALWHYHINEGRAISLRDWLEDEPKRILLLGNDHTNKAAIDGINQVIFKRVSELILDQDKDEQRKTWIVLDEFVRIGKLNGVVELATEGRDKGAAIILGFQDINGARAIYGKEVTAEILGQCSNVAFLRIQSPETADYASDFFKKEFREVESRSLQIKGGTEGIVKDGTINYKDELREHVLPGDFLRLKPANMATGIHGFRFSPYAHPEFEKFSLTRHETFDKLLEDKSVKGFFPFNPKTAKNSEQEASVQYLKKWDEQDYKRLNLTRLLADIAIDPLREEANKKEQRVRNLAEFSFLRGWPEADEAKNIASLSLQERSAFFRVLKDLKKQRLFLGSLPSTEAGREVFQNGSEDAYAIFLRVTEALKESEVRSGVQDRDDHKEDRKQAENDKNTLPTLAKEGAKRTKRIVTKKVKKVSKDEKNDEKAESESKE